jgi:tetratricopeptide (TPR) repeat protein
MYDAHYNLANLLMELRRYSQAVHHYKLALEIKPDLEKARAGLEAAQKALEGETRILSGTDTPNPPPLRKVPGNASSIPSAMGRCSCACIRPASKPNLSAATIAFIWKKNCSHLWKN